MWKMSTWNALKANWNFINGKIIAFDWCITMLVISWRVERSSVWSAVLPLVPCHSLKVKRSTFQLKRGESCQSRQRKYRASRRGVCPAPSRLSGARARGRLVELKGETRRMYRVINALLRWITSTLIFWQRLPSFCLTQCPHSSHSWPPRGVFTVLIVLKSDLNHRE